MKNAALLLTVIAAIAASAQSPNQFPKVEGLQPTPAYSQVVVSTPGKIIFVAGQVGVDKDGKVVGNDLQAQAKQVFDNIKTALAAAGATFDDVVKINWYVKNYKPEMRPILREVRAAYTNKEHPPASTLIGVTSLAAEEYLVEVEAIAIVAEKPAKKK
jgi:enamine deaminase RidA (YjgF/YER057c/UK114 family)